MTLRAEVLGPEHADEVRALYETYEWWADRDVEDVRTALENTDLAMGCRDGETGENEGEPLVQMVLEGE